MHYATAKANATNQKDLRKSLRSNMTPAETLLWKSLRGRYAGGWKFRRQQGIGPFVLDFFCPELRLCVELDGSAHDHTSEYDSQRTGFLAAQGIRVVRFNNEQVFTCLDGVVAEIVRVCDELAMMREQTDTVKELQTPPPAPPLEGRGEAERTADPLSPI